MQQTTEVLKIAWNRVIAANLLMNEFRAAEDDPQGQWAKGDRIAFGIQQKAGVNAYSAQNLTQVHDIQSAVEERSIPMREAAFTCQFNGYRALRPGGGRKALGPQPDISAAPEDCRFSCQNKADSLSLLTRSPLAELSLQHFNWNAYYNAAPIEPEGHFLWVPSTATDATNASADALIHLPQALSLSLLEDAFRLFEHLPGTLLFFNALHAGASVNHIHFQSMVYQRPLPVERWPLVQKKQGYSLAGYPAPLLVFEQPTSASAVFVWIEQLQAQGTPFNLMFVGQRIILIPRNLAHEIVSEFPGNGLAALGLCGRIVTVDRQAYLSANPSRIERAFEKMVLKVAF